MNEFELIRRLVPLLATDHRVVIGAGDDCSVLDIGLPGHWLLLKTDAVVSGVHFAAGADPEQVGHKALARCLSDIAAMGGDPISAVVALCLPEDCSIKWVEGLYRGLNRLAECVRMSVSGGETTKSLGGLSVTVSAVGQVRRDRCLRRSGAQPGDAIFVTGELGGSLSGRHLSFEPRLEQAQWLAAHWRLSAVIDLSDGLASDLRHVLTASQVGAELLAAAIPVSRQARRATKTEGSGKTPLLAALTDGEDFELLFSTPSKDAVPLLDAWKARFPELRLSCIGRMTRQPGLRIRSAKGMRELHETGYVHLLGKTE